MSQLSWWIVILLHSQSCDLFMLHSWAAKSCDPPSDQIQYHQSRMTRQLWLLCISEKMILCEQSVVCSVFTPPFNFAPLWTSFGVAPQKVPGTIHNFCHWRPTKYESNESYHTVEIYDIKFSFSYNYSQQVTIGLSCPQWRFGIEFRKKKKNTRNQTSNLL